MSEISKEQSREVPCRLHEQLCRRRFALRRCPGRHEQRSVEVGCDLLSAPKRLSRNFFHQNRANERCSVTLESIKKTTYASVFCAPELRSSSNVLLSRCTGNTSIDDSGESCRQSLNPGMVYDRCTTHHDHLYL